jgi:tRNA threonylcarbamoyladenosine biosynthesis protein TsaB
MRAILLETSCPHAEVALADEHGIVRRQHLSMARQHARDLIPALDTLLREEGWPARSVTHLAVDIGPGSYTGLRVGVVTAKMFAYATSAKVVGVDAMTLLALGSPPSARSVWGIIDAQQQQVYAGQFVRDNEHSSPHLVGAIEILPVDDWVSRLGTGDFVTGPGLSRFADQLPIGTKTAPPGEWSPKVDALQICLQVRMAGGSFDDPWELRPLYLRASSAQLRWDARTGTFPSEQT